MSFLIFCWVFGAAMGAQAAEAGLMSGWVVVASVALLSVLAPDKDWS